MIEIHLSAPETFEYNGIQITSTFVNLPDLPPLIDAALIGIDPGQVNMGLAILQGVTGLAGHLHGKVFQVKLPPETDMGARVAATFDIVGYLIEMSVVAKNIELACVENAAYQAVYGQAALAENRTAAVLALMKGGLRQIVVTPPLTIRKEVFGNGKIKAEETWPELASKDAKRQSHNDAASALACALYARQLYLERKET